MGAAGQEPQASPAAAFYDQVARVYDRLFAYGSDQTRQQTAWLTRMCPPGPLLDLGCGTGRMLAPLAAAGFAPVGLDCSRGMLAAARRAWPGAALVRAEAGAGLPFMEGAFACVTSLHAGLIHVTDPAARRGLVREVLRVLRPGGVFVAELPHPRSFPPLGEPGAWRPFRQGMACRRAGPGLEELRLEAMDGLSTLVAVLEVDDLGPWLAGFAKVHLYPGFGPGRFHPSKGAAMVVCAYK